jgi:predicted CopG family antitoxin
MSSRNKRGRPRNIYLDDDNWEKLELLKEVAPGEASHSSLIREAIPLLLKKYDFLVSEELKRRQTEKMKKLLTLSKQIKQK